METRLHFNSEDECLNLSGVVKWNPWSKARNVESITIRGLGKWRHFPANVLAVNERMIDGLCLEHYGPKLAKVGVNWVGMETKTDILISKAIRGPQLKKDEVMSARSEKAGQVKVIALLTKFFKALGASSVKIQAN